MCVKREREKGQKTETLLSVVSYSRGRTARPAGGDDFASHRATLNRWHRVRLYCLSPELP